MDERETVVETSPRPGATTADELSDTLAASDVRTAPDQPALPIRPPSPLETLRAEEAELAITIIRFGRVLGVALLILIPFLEGNQTALAVCALGVVLAIAAGVWGERTFRDPARYSAKAMIVVAAPTGLAAFAGITYLGLFSGGSTFLVLGIYFFSRRQSLGWALVAYLITAVVQAGLTGLIILGVIDDPGIFSFAGTSIPMQVLAQALVQVAFLGAFLFGRASHRATVVSIERLQHAMRLAAQRGALLDEARHDLNQVLQLGRAGRYTGKTLGSYELGDVIGRGGMGEIYEAHHVASGQIAAVKLLRPQALDDPQVVLRFLREVRAASSMDSPHVARVFEASEPGAVLPYFAMERLQGLDLADLLREKRPELTTDDLNKLLREASLLLEQARSMGIVHRDLKPRNLFLAERGAAGPVWKVLDFGVAALAEGTGTLTGGHVVGTPAYMAPEQARGAVVDHRADIYALAAVAYRWITGRPPFAGTDAASLLYQVAHVMPEKPSEFAEIDPDVDLVLALGLAKQPDDRFAFAPELAAAVESATSGHLDPALRERAGTVLAHSPWGSVLR